LDALIRYKTHRNTQSPKKLKQWSSKHLQNPFAVSRGATIAFWQSLDTRRNLEQARHPTSFRGRAFPKPYHQSSTSLLALRYPLALSNAAFITLAALLWWILVPHAQYLRNQSPNYAQIDVFSDRLLNDATNAAHSRTQSHDYIEILG
jgi:hypothetical protein